MWEFFLVIFLSFILKFKKKIGANQFKDLSLEHSFSTLIGFTEEELKENYLDIIKFYCEEDYAQTELNNIKAHYNGYKFSVSPIENRVFSPISVIRHLESSLYIFQSIKQKKNPKNEVIIISINLNIFIFPFRVLSFWKSLVLHGPHWKSDRVLSEVLSGES